MPARVLFTQENVGFSTWQNQCWTHTFSTSTFSLSPVSSWASQTTARRSESRRLACFSRSVYKTPKSNRSFVRLLLGNCLCKSQRRGSTLSFFSWLRSHYYLSNLAINQGQRHIPSWPIITKAMLSYFQRSEKEVLRVAVATWLATPPHQRCHRHTDMCVGGPTNDTIWYILGFRCILKHRSDFSQLPRSSSVRATQTRCGLTRREDEALVEHDKWFQPHISHSHFFVGFDMCSWWWWDLLDLFGQMPFVPKYHNPANVLPFGAWSTKAPVHDLKCQLKKLLHSSFQSRGVFNSTMAENIFQKPQGFSSQCL